MQSLADRLPPSLAARIAALNPRERRFLAVGGAIVVLLLLYLMLASGGEPEESAVELADAPPMAPSPPIEPPSYQPPAPAPVASAPVTAPAADPASVSGLVLHGVLGGGPGGGAAILSSGGAGQRVVRVGRPVLPGVTVKSVGIDHAILATASGDMRIAFNKTAQPEAAAGAPQGQASAPAGDAPTQASRQEQLMALRLGLAPRTAGGNIIGYVLKKGAVVPALQKAGAQPGDVLVAVGNDPLDSEERLFNLPEELAAQRTLTLERGGRRITVNIGG